MSRVFISKRFFRHKNVFFPIIFILFSVFFFSCDSITAPESSLLSDNQAKSEDLESDDTINSDIPGDNCYDQTGMLRETEYGSILGTTDIEDTLVWRGVPYAKPPVGELRWRPPQDPDSWSGVRSAETFCSMCAQYGNFISETGRDTFGNVWGSGVLVGSEDCLYMNIWRPRTDEKLPVLVFIHGGAWIIGRSDLSIYNGARLAARQDMVVVTINYRLGSLGWFAHNSLRNGDPANDSGNFGTLDTIKALEWIRDNIEHFGGDPDNVTISGQSAGGSSVMTLLISPLAQGLFHRAIIISGVALSWPMNVAEYRADTLLENLFIQDGLADSHSEAAREIEERGDAWIADYLRSKTLEDLFPQDMGAALGIQLNAGLLGAMLLGVYEDGHVMPGNLATQFSSGGYSKVPVMIGCTSEELKLFLPFFMTEPEILYDMMQAFDPDNPDYELQEILDPVLWPLLYAYDPIVKLGQVIFQVLGVDQTVKSLKKYQDNVYAYKFTWDEEPYPFDFFQGAAHAMDLPFLFGTFIAHRSSLTSFCWSEANREGRESLSGSMMDYYAQFARTGNPNRPGSGLPQWTAWDTEKGAAKRMILDSDALYMSSSTMEVSEILTVQDIIEEVTGIIANGQ